MDSQPEPEIHLSAPNFSTPDAVLRDSSALDSWLRQSALNESQGVLSAWEGLAPRGGTGRGYERTGSLRDASGPAVPASVGAPGGRGTSERQPASPNGLCQEA